MGARRALSLRVGAASTKGRREENQDRMTRFASAFGEVLAVADGMGGYRGGAQAAEHVVASLSARLQEADPSQGLEQALETTFDVINRELHERGHSGDSNLNGMGSTLVMAILSNVDEGVAVRVAHVGDSRAYLWRRGKLRLITRDHSVLEELALLGVSAEEARKRPDWSHLTRAFGPARSLRPDLSEAWLLAPGDRLLLCSDGLHGFLPEGAIAELLGDGRPPGDAAESLVRRALDNGSDDNVSVQVIEAAREAALVAPPLPATAPMTLPALFVAALFGAAGAAYWGAQSGWFSPQFEAVAPPPPAQVAIPAQPQRTVAPAPQPPPDLPSQPPPCDLTIICTLSCESWKSQEWWREIKALAPNSRLHTVSSALSSVPALPAAISGGFLLDDDGSAAGRRLRARIEDVLWRHEMPYTAEALKDKTCQVVLQLPPPLDP